MQETKTASVPQCQNVLQQDIDAENLLNYLQIMLCCHLALSPLTAAGLCLCVLLVMIQRVDWTPAASVCTSSIYLPISYTAQDLRTICLKRPLFPWVHEPSVPERWYSVTADEGWPICMSRSAPRREEGPFFCHLLRTEPPLPTGPIDFNWLEVRLLSQRRHKEAHSGPASADPRLGYTSSLVQSGEPKTR